MDILVVQGVAPHWLLSRNKREQLGLGQPSWIQDLVSAFSKERSKQGGGRGGLQG